MSGSINQIQNIFFTIMEIFHLNCMTLNCNTSLPFKVHIIKHLCLIFPFGYCIGLLQQPVGQCTFTMINMSYYTEISDIVHRTSFL